MKAGTWPSITLIYLYGVLTSASLSKIIPLAGDLATHLGATPAQFGLLISLMSVPAALLAAVAGSIIDRIGARVVLIVSAGIGVLTNLAYLGAGTLQAFMAVRVFEGLLTVGIYAAAPALIMATSSDARRGRAMAVWSTYTPVGISLGLLLSASHAGTAHWRGGYAVHLALFAVLVLAGWWLPRLPPAPAQARGPAPGLFSVMLQSGPLRLSLTFAMLLLMGFGVNTVFPEWFAQQHQMPVGKASGILATTNLVMIPGGLLAGWLLAHGRRDKGLLAVVLMTAMVSSLPLFLPGIGQPARFVAMVVWLLAQGAALAIVAGSLPRVVASPTQGAAAAGLLSQIAALMTFATPLIWRPILHSGRWMLFLVVVAASVVAALLLFPRRKPG